jgi:hypothetical protein
MDPEQFAWYERVGGFALLARISYGSSAIDVDSRQLETFWKLLNFGRLMGWCWEDDASQACQVLVLFLIYRR